jgi:hypothetical protein
VKLRDTRTICQSCDGESDVISDRPKALTLHVRLLSPLLALADIRF